MTHEDLPQPDPLAPYPTPDERDSGRLPEPDLFKGVPAHLDIHLRNWVAKTLVSEEHLARTVATRCRMAWSAISQDVGGRAVQMDSRGAVNLVMAGKTEKITSPRPLDRLTIVDAIINLHPDWEPI